LPLPPPLPLFQHLGEDIGFGLVKDWTLTFCMCPRRCFISKKWIFLKKAYKGKAYIYNYRGPEARSETYWVSTDAFLVWKLTGKR